MRDFLKKVANFAKSHPIALSSIFVAGLIGAGVWAWGPNRETFTVENPATYVTFNSITNNPHLYRLNYFRKGQNRLHKQD